MPSRRPAAGAAPRPSGRRRRPYGLLPAPCLRPWSRPAHHARRQASPERSGIRPTRSWGRSSSSAAPFPPPLRSSPPVADRSTRSWSAPGERSRCASLRGARDHVSLGYASVPQGEVGYPDGHPAVTFVACQPESSGSTAGLGEPVTFWSGFVFARKPSCAPLDIQVGGDVRRIEIPLGDRCQRPLGVGPLELRLRTHAINSRSGRFPQKRRNGCEIGRWQHRGAQRSRTLGHEKAARPGP